MIQIENNPFLAEKLWLKQYTLNGLRESPKSFGYFQEKIREHISLNELCKRHPEDEHYIRDCSSKYHWPEREQAKTSYELSIIQEIQEELLTVLASREKITKNLEIDDRLEKIIQRVLDVIDLKIDSLLGISVDISPELQKTKLPSLLMALEKLLSGRNTHYRNLLRQLGLPEVLHEDKEEKIIVKKDEVTDKPSDEELRKRIDEKLASGSQKIQRKEVYDT